MVHRDHRRRHHRGAPVAIRQEEGQRDEDVEVRLHHPVTLVNEERGIDHERHGDRKARDRRPRPRARQPDDDQRNGDRDAERRPPRPVQRGEEERNRKVQEKEEPELSINVDARPIEQRASSGGRFGERHARTAR